MPIGSASAIARVWHEVEAVGDIAEDGGVPASCCLLTLPMASNLRRYRRRGKTPAPLPRPGRAPISSVNRGDMLQWRPSPRASPKSGSIAKAMAASSRRSTGPFAGARFERALPAGDHPFQLYSLATPNGVKVTVMLEELLAAGHADAEYDAWRIDITAGDQFGSGFTAINPNGKIPALIDRSDPERPVRLFESGAMLLHLADKFGALLAPRGAGADRDLELAVLADGRGPAARRRLRPFLRLCARAVRLCPRPLCDGSQAPARPARQKARRGAVPRGRGLYDRRYRRLAVVRPAGARPGLRGRRRLPRRQEPIRALLEWAERIAERPAVRRGKIVNKSGVLDERHSAADIDRVLEAAVKPGVRSNCCARRSTARSERASIAR